MAEVVVSGLGLISALGLNPGSHETGLLAGRRALGEGDLIDFSPFHSRVVAQVPSGPRGGGGRRTWLLKDALRQALEAAGIPALPEGSLLVVVGQAPWIAEAEADPALRDFVAPEPRLLPGLPEAVEIAYLSHACASAGFGIEFASRWLEAGVGPMAAVVGAVALNRYEYASMDSVRVLSPSGARPFHPRRDGTTVGEGGAAVVLERRSDARGRGHSWLARIAGVACRVGGASRSGVDPRSVGECLESALAAAGGPPIDYVQAHGTGTRQGDEAELELLAQAARHHRWGADVPVASSKGAVGHLLHASMFTGFAAALTALRSGVLPGTPGLDASFRRDCLSVLGDPERRGRIGHVLVNAFGFGGNNSVLVVGS
jgi:3-oxoacyl-[acyl-carrier-protein] synthase II